MRDLKGFINKAITYVHVKVLSMLDRRVWTYAPVDTARCVFHTVDHEAVKKYYPDFRFDGHLEGKSKYDLFHEEFLSSYLYHVKDGTIDPKSGWVITDKWKVFDRSFPYAQDPWDNQKAKPSVLNYVLPKKVKTLESCIYVRYGWINYYHFFFDTLPQICLANEKLDKSIPLLIPEWSQQMKFVREFFETSDLLGGREVIIQKHDEYCKVSNIYLCKQPFYSGAVFNILSSFRLPEPPPQAADRAVFLSRKSSRGRTIRNHEEIEAIMREAGIEIVDTDGMSLLEQRAFFSGVKNVIAIHGAGLTNVIFRCGKEMSLIELFPAHLSATFYKDICTLLGYEYDMITGSHLDSQNSFYVDPALLRQKIADGTQPYSSQSQFSVSGASELKETHQGA